MPMSITSPHLTRWDLFLHCCRLDSKGGTSIFGLQRQTQLHDSCHLAAAILVILSSSGFIGMKAEDDRMT